MAQRCFENNPFEDGTALDALRSLPSFEEALSRLVYLAEHGRPCGIVRGPEGSGKSPLLHSVMHELHRTGQECGIVDLRRTSAEEFAWQVACELGTAPAPNQRHRNWQLIEDALQGRALAGRATVLVLDHLGEQPIDLQRELNRLLSIAETSAGWTTVLGATRSVVMAKNRFSETCSELRIELGPFDGDETATFLHRVAQLTGCYPFDDDAARLLHEYSRGLLRPLMLLARLALIARSAEAAPHVTEEIVRRVAAEVSPQSITVKPAPVTALMTTAD